MATAFTIGHSTHTLERLLDLLRAHDVRALADVRAHPGSRRVPHTARETLDPTLAGQGIAYVHLPELGGRRRPRPGSPNAAWKVEAFRGYADHMDSAEFAEGLRRLEELARDQATAFMCAEAPWWRCHRRLVADALVARGWTVGHIGPRGELTEHELPEFAVVNGGRVGYPPPQLEPE